jgi:hypothetical protein
MENWLARQHHSPFSTLHSPLKKRQPFSTLNFQLSTKLDCFGLRPRNDEATILNAPCNVIHLLFSKWFRKFGIPNKNRN